MKTFEPFSFKRVSFQQKESKCLEKTMCTLGRTCTNTQMRNATKKKKKKNGGRVHSLSLFSFDCRRLVSVTGQNKCNSVISGLYLVQIVRTAPYLPFKDCGITHYNSLLKQFSKSSLIVFQKCSYVYNAIYSFKVKMTKYCMPLRGWQLGI